MGALALRAVRAAAKGMAEQAEAEADAHGMFRRRRGRVWRECIEIESSCVPRDTTHADRTVIGSACP